MSDSPPPSVMLVAHPDRAVSPALGAMTLGPLVNDGASLALVIVMSKFCGRDRLARAVVERDRDDVDPWASVAGVNVRPPTGEIAGCETNSAVLSASTV